MYLLQIPQSFDPKVNLATEEYVVRHLDITDDLLFIYRNQPSVIIGKNQNPFEEINLNYILKENIMMYRRISGGGAVYHDPGNINFSYITKNTSQNFNNYRNFLQPVIDFLKSKGVPASINKRNDIVIKDYKISGNAQFATRGRMFSHGTLLFNSDLEKIRHSLEPDNNTIESKSTKSVRSRITNIAAFLNEYTDISFFLRDLVQFIINHFHFFGYINLNNNQLSEIQKLALEKYGSWQWNWGRTPKFIKNILHPNNNDIIHLEIENCIINSKDLNPVDSFIKLLFALDGTRFNKSDIRDAIDSISKQNDSEKTLILERIF